MSPAHFLPVVLLRLADQRRREDIARAFILYGIRVYLISLPTTSGRGGVKKLSTQHAVFLRGVRLQEQKWP
ncbi:hypothetical protein V5799_017407 [Amblyomma americanum]|uniref:Uncharacterized protein n=1 Tax=Amblyomma americanum TaxID=6943 RepID=A0AAQ4F3H4_AMBAM